MNRTVAFGRKMKAIREGLGYSQERLAELARLHRTYIGGVERGERNVSLLNIWRIADALGVTPSVLFAASVDEAASTGAPALKGAEKKDGKWTRGRRH
jgi:transcriptional regulator with XRE-family HTH domain